MDGITVEVLWEFNSSQTPDVDPALSYPVYSWIKFVTAPRIDDDIVFVAHNKNTGGGADVLWGRTITVYGRVVRTGLVGIDTDRYHLSHVHASATIETVRFEDYQPPES